jgi:hypothetical protein
MTSQAEEAEIQDYVNEIIRKPAEEVRVTRFSTADFWLRGSAGDTALN